MGASTAGRDLVDRHPRTVPASFHAMARLNWAAVEPEHYQRGAEWVASNWSGSGPRLFVEHDGVRLPAKLVAAAAYRLAHNMPTDAELRFSSGQGVLDRLRSAGLAVGRDESVRPRGGKPKIPETS